jgi:type VI secretion system secreted protein Hcp
VDTNAAGAGAERKGREMALNSYAQLTLNGTALTGDVSLTEIGGVDVSSQYVELLRVTFGAAAARTAVTGQATGRRQFEPIRFVKRIDSSTPLLYQALAQNQRVAGTILLFGVDPADGSTRNFFTIEAQNGAITAISDVSPDTRDPAVSTWDAYEEVSLAFAAITLTHVPSGTQMQDQIGRIL